MPQLVEQHLRKSARKLGKKGRAADRYVYGAMNNMGLMHGNKPASPFDAILRKKGNAP